MKMLRTLLQSVLCVVALSANAQKSTTPKFGKISPQDFEVKAEALDSSANAIVIADIGSSQFTGNQKGWFSLEYKFYRRAIITSRNGYDIASVEIPLYVSGSNEEKLDGLKACTYNLEGGKVVSTKLDAKSGVFKEQKSKNWMVRKFTFPNLKEGSIIEYEYTVVSPYLFSLHSWQFQSQYPHLWSEYTVSIPQFFNYVSMAQGYQPFYIKDQKVDRQDFTITDVGTSVSSDRTSFTSNVTNNRWVMKDVPPLKEENFTSTLSNHIAQLDFQLSEHRDPLPYKRIMGTWQEVAGDMMKDENFGFQLTKDNNWLGDDVKDIVEGAKTPEEKARKIFAFVRDKFTCTGYNRLYAQQNLKDVLKKRSGNEAELNLLLVAMLRKAGLSADPVLLSTRKHGYSYPLYPLMEKFNHVVCITYIDGRSIYLDASSSNLGFGKLGYECYNGHARIMNESATPLDFISDSLMERKLTSVFVINAQNGKGMTGSKTQTMGYYESLGVRDTYKEKGKDFIFAGQKKSLGGEATLSNSEIDSLQKLESPVTVRFEFDQPMGDEDILYISPMFGEAYKENPFKSAQRFYPVEMPFAMDETYLLRLEIPTGYVVDEMPKQMIVKMNEEGDGMFEYRISQSEGAISLRSRLYLKRAFYAPEEYDMLREFFNLIVKKQAEQIVFKKKK